MVLDEPKNDRDSVYDYENLRMVIDKELLGQLGAVSVDYRNTMWRTGFAVTSEKDIRGGGGASCSSGGSCC